MKKKILLALIGVLTLATSASATDRGQFLAKVMKSTGNPPTAIRDFCICKETNYMNRVGYLSAGAGPAGPPSLNVSAVGVGCGVPTFYNSDLESAYVYSCNTSFLVLPK